MKKKLSALTGTLVLFLFAPLALADVSGIPNWSGNEIQPTFGEIKNRRQCDGAAFFKNVFPSLTNGGPGGSDFIDFNVDGDNVRVTVDWYANNSFDFTIAGGYATKVGVTVDQNNFIYDYTGSPSDGVADTQLNFYGAGLTADDVNHLDLCLAKLDTEPPVVEIIFPQDDATVPVGIVQVKALVTDNEAIASVVATVDSDLLSAPIVLALDNDATQPPEYVWQWDATNLEPGIYTITVGATDTSIIINGGSDSVVVELVFSAASCVGFRNDDDPAEGEGCNPTGKVNIQVPAINNFINGPGGCDDQTGTICTITGDLLKPDPLTVAALVGPNCEACSICPADSFPDPRMSFVNGKWVPTDFSPLVVFAELGLSDDSPSFPDDALILNQYTFGFPCIVIAKHNKNFSLVAGFSFWPNQDDPNTLQDEATGVVFPKTLFPERVVLPPELRPKCYGEDGNFDLQEANQGVYQTTDKALMFGGTAAVLTDACFNPARTMTRTKSFDVSGTVEHAGISFGTATGPEEVLAFKFQMAELAFDALFFAIDNAAAATDEDGSACLKSGKISEVTRKANQARSQFNKFNLSSLGRAIGDLNDLVDVVRSKQDWCVIEENHAGDILSQSYGLIWRVEQIRDEIIRVDGL